MSVVQSHYCNKTLIGPLHSAEPTKLRVAELFRCLLCVHFVQNLEIILLNCSSSYKMLVKFLDSWLAHSLKVTFFKGQASKLSEMKVKTISFQLFKGISFTTWTSWDIHVWTLVMFMDADQILEIFLDLQFLLCILPDTCQ